MVLVVTIPSQSCSAELTGLLKALNLDCFSDAGLDMCLGCERTEVKDTI